MEEILKIFEEKDKKLNKETEIVRNKLWTSFQKTAEAVSKVYMSCISEEEEEEETKPLVDEEKNKPLATSSRSDNFSIAAQSTTQLYKDSVECISTLSGSWKESGENKKTIEILNFLEGKRKVNKTELINFLINSCHSNNCEKVIDSDDINEKFGELFKNCDNHNNRKRNRTECNCHGNEFCNNNCCNNKRFKKSE